MDKQNETFNTWNKMAELYEKKFMDLETYNSSYDTFCNNLSSDDARILDIGTGPGNIPNYLLSILPGLNIEGIDIAPNMVERAQKNIPNGKFSVLDSRDIHKLEGPYNGIVCGFCIPYLNAEETENLISNAYQLLEVQGMLYISFVEGEMEESGYKTNSDGDRVYFNFHELAHIEQMTSKAGFTEFEVSKVQFSPETRPNEMHTIVQCRK